MRPLLFATAALLFSSATLAAEAEQFTIRHAAPALGTHLRAVRFVLDVPPAKNYEELTQQQKNKVKANYQDMADADEPPYPLGGVRDLFTVLSDVQHYWKATGELDMVATVQPDGTVSLVSVYKTPDIRMTQYMAQILAVQKFKPALCEGVPCAMDYPLRMHMRRKENGGFPSTVH